MVTWKRLWLETHQGRGQEYGLTKRRLHDDNVSRRASVNEVRVRLALVWVARGHHLGVSVRRAEMVRVGWERGRKVKRIGASARRWAADDRAVRRRAFGGEGEKATRSFRQLDEIIDDATPTSTVNAGPAIRVSPAS